MGVVYEVEHVRTGQRLALKVLTQQPGASVERFKREARAASRIQSEHIVRVTDADVAPELGGAPFLVMELLEGADLERVTGTEPAAPADVLVWLRQVARALGKAHAAGIVHRDLKPENLFLTRREDGSPLVKILDFGIAKMAAEVTVLTQSDSFLGTPGYMAPEQTDSRGPPVTFRADLYALGLIAFKLLTGPQLLEEREPGAASRADPRRSDATRRPSAGRRSGPPSTRGSCARAIATRPSGSTRRSSRSRRSRWRWVAGAGAALGFGAGADRRAGDRDDRLRGVAERVVQRRQDGPEARRPPLARGRAGERARGARDRERSRARRATSRGDCGQCTRQRNGASDRTRRRLFHRERGAAGRRGDRHGGVLILERAFAACARARGTRGVRGQAQGRALRGRRAGSAAQEGVDDARSRLGRAMTTPRSIASLAAAVTLAAWLAPSTASANPAAAEVLFREGRRLLDEGKTEEACLKLAQSEAEDPSSGTLLNLGLCHEIQHKLASAWSEYISAAQLARDQGRADRAAAAEKKAAQLEPRLPYLTVTVAAPVEGLEVARGGERVGPELLGSAVPLDPGSYVVTARAPGHRPWKTTVDVAEAESRTVQVPELEPQAPPPAATPVVPPPAPTAVAPVAPAPLAPTAPPPPSHSALGWVVGGTGAVALAVGAGFGVSSLASYHDANALCPSHTECNNSALSARSSAESKAWVSNIAMGAGVVGVGIGTWILLTGRHGHPATQVAVGGALGAGGVRVSVERSF